MSEMDLVIECMPQITEMAIAVKGMSAGEYEQFKQEHLEDVKKTCPKALGFISNIYKLIEWSLAV